MGGGGEVGGGKRQFQTETPQKRKNTRPDSRRELPKLMPHHLLRDRHIVVYLPVVHLELEPDEVRQDGRAARLRLDGGRALAWFGADDGEAGGEEGRGLVGTEKRGAGGGGERVGKGCEGDSLGGGGEG